MYFVQPNDYRKFLLKMYHLNIYMEYRNIIEYSTPLYLHLCEYDY